MGEANVQSQNQPFMANSPPQSPICNHPRNKEVVEPTDLFSVMHLTNAKGCCHRHPPCTAASSNPMKRRPPPTTSSSGEPCAKKLFCDQEDLSLSGFSVVPIPLNINSLVNKRRPVLRRCVSDPYNPPAPVPEQPTSPARGVRLPPLPPRFRRSVSDISAPSPDKAMSCLSTEENATPDSVRLRRMKERLKEMRQWWDEVMKEDEEEEGGQEECARAEDDKVPAQVPAQEDLGGGDSEEAVSVEWVERCLSLGFGCPCGKNYEVLLSENNCYYKLV